MKLKKLSPKIKICTGCPNKEKLSLDVSNNLVFGIQESKDQETKKITIVGKTKEKNKSKNSLF